MGEFEVHDLRAPADAGPSSSLKTPDEAAALYRRWKALAAAEPLDRAAVAAAAESWFAARDAAFHAQWRELQQKLGEVDLEFPDPALRAAAHAARRTTPVGEHLWHEGVCARCLARCALANNTPCAWRPSGKSASYDEWLRAHLADPERAADYLAEHFEDEDADVFLQALRDATPPPVGDVGVVRSLKAVLEARGVEVVFRRRGGVIAKESARDLEQALRPLYNSVAAWSWDEGAASWVEPADAAFQVLMSCVAGDLRAARTNLLALEAALPPPVAVAGDATPSRVTAPAIPMPHGVARREAYGTARCDMASGPCSCGSTHSLPEWRARGLLPSDQLTLIDDLSAVGLPRWQLRSWLHELGGVVGLLAALGERGKTQLQATSEELDDARRGEGSSRGRLAKLAERLRALHREGRAALEGGA